MHLVPVSLAEARAFVQEHHRHNGPPRGWRFGTALHADDGSRIGVATAGRPVSRVLDDGVTLEITRVCVLPDKRNANSMLYGAMVRAGKALGYRRFYSYTLPGESGASLKAVGFREDGIVKGREWDTPSRRRQSSADAGYSTEDKIRWILD